MTRHDVTIDVQKYTWGRLVVLRAGIDFSVPLHPEDVDKLRNLGSGRRLKLETGASWRAYYDHHVLVMTDGDHELRLTPDQRDTVLRTAELSRRCAWCGRWLVDGRWVELDVELQTDELDTSHGMCPSCADPRDLED